MSEAKIVHLAEPHGAYDDPDTWCGESSFSYTEDLDLVTCENCLRVAIIFGKDAERRSNDVRS